VAGGIEGRPSALAVDNKTLLKGGTKLHAENSLEAKEGEEVSAALLVIYDSAE